MKRHALLIPLALSLLFTPASAYPNAPGTCNLQLMHTIGHGPSLSTCDDCYSVRIEQSDASSPMDITIVGRRPYQGLLLQIKNSDNITVGEFVDYSEDMFVPVVCEDEDVAAGERPEGWAGSIGHVDPKFKTWPVQLRWSSATQDVLDSPSPHLRVQGMVVLDYDNWHLLPEMPFTVRKPKQQQPLPQSPTPTTTTKLEQADPTNPTTTTTTTTTTTVITTATTTISPLAEATLIASEPVERVDESTTLFLQVLCLILSMYFMMALARKRWRRGRTVADPEQVQHTH